jgi:hypothetical protein
MKLAFKAIGLSLTLSFGWLATAENARAGNIVPTRNDGITQAGNILAYALPAAAFGLTLGLKDREGSWEFGESAAITMGLTVALKYSVNSTRPNGEAHAFPSGHAAISFSTAEFLRQRYGWEYGLPAYALASFVAYSRIHAHEHNFRDVSAGALIGIGTSYLITKPYHGWKLEPTVGMRAYGLSASRDY